MKRKNSNFNDTMKMQVGEQAKQKRNNASPKNKKRNALMSREIF